MADRSIAVRLTAQVGGFVSGMRTAQSAASDFAGRGLDKIAQHSASIDTIANSAGILGAAMLAGFGAATKAAVDWESAFAGVMKTVDETATTTYADLEDGLRELAQTMPATHEEIAGVAEAAGQLGIAADDVVDFTETMIQLGVTTNLSAEEAATSLARIGNIMGTSASDVDRMGATIVELGNNSATTEREIAEMATRLAAAGRQAGLTESDLFAIASTMTSVGVEAEAGGTAMSKVFTAIGDAVRSGNEDLEVFAEVAGMTAEEFQTAFGEDAAMAIGAFVEGMGNMSNAGQNTSEIFQTLGLTDQRLMRSILSAGAATGMWAEQVELANGAWGDNSALIQEAMTRFQTSESQMTIAWNNIRDAAIEFGAVVLPILADVARGVSELATFFGDLPPAVQGVTMAIAGVGGLALLGVSGLGRLATTVAGLRQAFQNLGTTARTAGLAVSGIGLAFGAATAGVLAWANAQAEARARTQELADTLDDVSGALTDASREWAVKRLVDDDALDSVERLGVNMEDLTDAMLGSADAAARVEAQMDAAAGSYGILEQRQYMQDMMELRGHMEDAANETEEARRIQDALNEAQAGGATSAESAATGQEALGDAMEDTTAIAEEQADVLGDTVEQISALGNAALSARDAQRGLEQAMDDARAAVEENGETFDITTQKGRDNQAALDGVAAAGWRVIESMQENGARADELHDSMASVRQDFIDTATDMGLTGERARELADDFGLIPDEVVAQVRSEGIGQVEADVNGLIAEIDGLTGTVTIDGENVPGRRKLADLMQEIGVSTEDVTIDGDPIPANMTLSDLMSRIRNSEDDVTIDGDNQEGRSALSALVTAIAQSYAEIDVGADTSGAEAAAASAVSRIANRSVSIPIYGVYRGSRGVPSLPSGTRAASAYATGGYVSGPGTGTSDSIPARLSNGEYVVSASAVSAYGKDFFDAVNAQRFASGGMVGRYQTASFGNAPVNVTASTGPVTAYLAAEDRALLQAVASRPVALNGRIVTQEIARTNQQLGGIIK